MRCIQTSILASKGACSVPAAPGCPVTQANHIPSQECERESLYIVRKSGPVLNPTFLCASRLTYANQVVYLESSYCILLLLV
eukprot:1457887-Amphidinium_carterae.2